MPANKFKERLRAGDQMIGIWSMLAHTSVLEVITQTPYDWVLVDTEHSPNELPMVIEQLRSVKQSGMPSLVRASHNNTVEIKRLLDAGVQTVVVPMVDNEAQARQAVAAVRYPPQGVRGVSLATRANNYGTEAGYLANANEQVCLLVQIETLEAVDNLEKIAAIDGIDGLFIGPSDLAAAMGHLGNFKHPEVQAAIMDVLARSHAAGKPIGILMADPQLSEAYIRAGFDYVAVITDIGLLRQGADATLARCVAFKRAG
ncbi:MAG: HpcH/HpaI aldolase/citrate lyase family protein [Massilia sp.]